MQDIDTIIGFFGAIPILALFVALIRKKINVKGIAILVVSVYTGSIATGIIADEYFDVNNMHSAMTAGWFAPAAYCFILVLLVRFAPFLIIKEFRYGNRQHETQHLNILDLPPDAGEGQNSEG